MKHLESRVEEENLVITWNVEEKQLEKSATLCFKHSKHSLKRANQRNIDSRIISTVIEYGTEFFKQGMIFYVLGKNSLPKNSILYGLKEYQNLIVVVAGDSNTIITCYRSKNPFKHIKKKQKNMGRIHFNAA
ncbi:DUF4258 domain-containing protein [Maribacter dokdonensis]|uniref:DUF4258 domain-containing protein n=1 Tax=Maribacter dokdonensis TaxID=320912 RepID=UPI0007198D3F|nr:DUF4258 domain-containing protein [Maribacter dokdonensis]KSA14194.1 hypothetical protein I600_787 [Maribacter dokdonensis DSW-8]